MTPYDEIVAALRRDVIPPRSTMSHETRTWEAGYNSAVLNAIAIVLKAEKQYRDKVVAEATV